MSRRNRLDETPEEYRGLHRVLLGVSTFFFAYLVVEGAVLVPWMFMHYGLH